MTGLAISMGPREPRMKSRLRTTDGLIMREVVISKEPGAPRMISQQMIGVGTAIKTVKEARGAGKARAIDTTAEALITGEEARAIDKTAEALGTGETRVIDKTVVEA